ncbi:hypothetical protein BJ912DRAFT_1149926 [Pholiota molesta]|nr:hypothetical protein BJ912DRAFT_1149926 [Pholiota molesta]
MSGASASSACLPPVPQQRPRLRVRPSIQVKTPPLRQQQQASLILPVPLRVPRQRQCEACRPPPRVRPQPPQIRPPRHPKASLPTDAQGLKVANAKPKTNQIAASTSTSLGKEDDPFVVKVPAQRLPPTWAAAASPSLPAPPPSSSASASVAMTPAASTSSLGLPCQEFLPKPGQKWATRLSRPRHLLSEIPRGRASP